MFLYAPLLPAAAEIQATPTVNNIGYLKYWNGSLWLIKPVKYWNGTTWTQKPVKFWDGATWTTTTPT